MSPASGRRPYRLDLAAHEVGSHFVCHLAPAGGVVQLQICACQRQQEDLLMQQRPLAPRPLLPRQPRALPRLQPGDSQGCLPQLDLLQS